ncbi:MAG: ATP-binding protein [candidate division NC10 bacterium]|nr:ATP-binding protein [candidate division NC10 bacterium]
MKIAVASGKGGTGKTTVATNLALILSRERKAVRYLDCDVEEPNGHIFLRPRIRRSRTVTVLVPQVDMERCTGCGQCAQICQFSAIVCIQKKVLTFPELCHGCGGCTLVCPEKAISEMPREVGIVEEGDGHGIEFAHGRLRIGEAMAPPVIREVKRNLPEEGVAILDAPPGTSCPAIESIKGTDFVLLVTEPTPFGLNDLKLAVKMVRALAIPFGVFLNRCDLGDDGVGRYCEEEKIAILGEIPEDRRIALAYSRGEMAARAIPEYGRKFRSLFDAIRERVER